MGAAVPELGKHRFGHFVVQSLLTNGSAADKHEVARRLCQDLPGFAVHRHSSYLVETMLHYCAEFKDEIVSKLCTDTDTIKQFAKSRFACYVLQALHKVQGN